MPERNLSRTRKKVPSLAGVTFLDNERLIAYAVDRDLGQLSSRESPEVSSPFRLHAWVVDANSGKMEAHKEWGTRVHDSAVQVTTGGVLVKTGGIVRLYSSDFAQARDLPLALDPNRLFYTKVSASGKTIAVSWIVQREHGASHVLSHVSVLDANTLKIRSSWDQYPPLYSAFSISDEQISIRHRDVIAVTEFGNPNWSTILDDPVPRRCLAGTPPPVLVADRLVFAPTCENLLLLSTSGASYSLPLNDGDSDRATATAECEPYNGMSKIAVTSDGRFVALSVPAVKDKKHLLTETTRCLTAVRVAVYDLTLKKHVLTVDVDPLPKNDYDFALSSDGSKLAILNDRKVSVYTVPIQSSERGD